VKAYSHDPFARRVASTYAFVREILSLVAERRTQILRLSTAPTAQSSIGGHTLGVGYHIPLTETLCAESRE